MSYAIVGFGKIGQALAKAFARKGIEVSVATTRDPQSFASAAAAPHAAEVMQQYFAAPGVAEVTAMRNGTLQGAYLIIAARALGLDCGPMSGSHNAGVDEAFSPARESSRTLSAALATAIQLPCSRAILA